jgi:hypothetical protein
MEGKFQRGLNHRFINDLKAGILKPLLEAVHADGNLILEIRNNYVNIYYRGGNVLKIDQSDTGYAVSFDEKYGGDKDKETLASFLADSQINKDNDSEKWAERLPVIKTSMDRHLVEKKSTLEREFQQLVVRENNLLRTSNDTDYYIVDFEYQSNDTRFDLVALRWDSTASEKKNPKNCRIAIIEVKFGDAALDEESGILDHIEKTEQFLSNEQTVKDFKNEMLTVFKQKRELGLIWCSSNGNEHPVSSVDDKIEFIFLLAGHKPANGKLSKILGEVKPMQNTELKFATASFMGYSLYSDKMLGLDDFRKLLK